MHSTIVGLRVYDEAHKLKLKMQDEMMYLSGIYTYEAVTTALANAFRGKGKKATEYRKEPLLANLDKTEEEILKEKRIAFANRIKRIGENFQQSRGKQDG